MTTDKDDIKAIVEESIKELMEQREKEWETKKMEIKKAQEASKQDQETIRAKIQSLKEANESMKAANDAAKASNEALNASMNARFDSLEANLLAYFRGGQPNPPPAPMIAPTEPRPEVPQATQGATINEPSEMETEEPAPLDMDLKPAAEPKDAEEMLDADESTIGSPHPVPPPQPNDDSTEHPSDAPPQQEPMTEPTPTPTSDIHPDPVPTPTKDAPTSEATETTPSKRPFSMGKTAKEVTFQTQPYERRLGRIFQRPPAPPATRSLTRTTTASFDEVLETHNAHRSPEVRLERLRRMNNNETPDKCFDDHQDPARCKKGEHTVSPMKTSQLFESDDENDDENENDNNKGGAGANNNNNNDASPGAS
jgi:hypothetical protein